jgi:hypothetical protein
MSLKDEKEIDAMLNEMPEAKSSVSYSLVSKSGFPLIFTVRSSDEGELLELMNDLENTLVDRGYTSDKKGYSNSTSYQKPLSVSSTTSEGATEKQRSLLKAKNLWEEGMTKAEASKLISSVLGK